MVHPPYNKAPIGVFDSGLGGLTVASAIAARLPDEPMIYLGDTARVPYGTRSPSTVVRYARNNVAFLHTFQVKLVVVACNTASAHALGGLADGATTPVIGVIRPGARAALAASRGGAIGVLGTEGTVRSEAYVQAIHELDPGRKVVQVACPLFVPLVEEGWSDHAVTGMVAEEYLSALDDQGVDTVILGCTHYPLLAKVIARVIGERLGPEVALVDSAQAVAGAVADFLEQAGSGEADPGRLAAHHRFFVTDAPAQKSALARRFWCEADDHPTLTFEHVDLSMQA